MSPENTHKLMGFYMEAQPCVPLILSVNYKEKLVDKLNLVN